MMDDRTGYKLFIRDVVERSLHKREDGGAYIDYGSHMLSTVRVMGVVVSKYEAEKFTIVTLDDSTETISIRAFGEDKGLFENISLGTTIDVIGALREYEGETYIAPRTVWQVEDPHWEVVRNLELLIRAKKSGITTSVEEVLDEEAPQEEGLKPAVLALIEKLNAGDGADYNALLKESGLEDTLLDRVLNDLLTESEIYEPKIGKFKRV